MEEITPLATGVKSYIYHRLGEITPLVTGLKSCKKYIYISPTGRNCAVSYWRKILHIYIYIYISPTGRNYAVSYWRKILHINTTDWKKLRRKLLA